jgi:hypothetical protein
MQRDMEEEKELSLPMQEGREGTEEPPRPDPSASTPRSGCCNIL